VVLRGVVRKRGSSGSRKTITRLEKSELAAIVRVPKKAVFVSFLDPETERYGIRSTCRSAQ